MSEKIKEAVETLKQGNEPSECYGCKEDCENGCEIYKAFKEATNE